MIQTHWLFKLVLLWSPTFVFGLLSQPKAEDNAWTTFISKTILAKTVFDDCSVKFLFGRNTTFQQKKALSELFNIDKFQ